MDESQRSGSLKREKEGYFLEKFGVYNPFQDESIKSQIRETNNKRYGEDSPAKSKEIKEKSKQTCLRKYGTEHTADKNSPVRDKIVETNFLRHGGSSPFSSNEVREKAKKKKIEKYGVDCNFRVDDFYKTTKETLLRRYGVTNSFLIPEIAERARSKEASQKRLTTAKNNSKFLPQGVSKIELIIGDEISKIFGHIERQVIVNCWLVDIYVKTIDTYVQVDGLYWHGKDRPLSVIEELKFPRDKTILRTVKKDKEQNVWFEKNEMRLVRITDAEWKFNVKNRTTEIFLLERLQK